MFTGIIERMGTVASLELHESEGGRLRLRGDLEKVKRGDSIAVNGVCITLRPVEHDLYEADLSPETIQRTTLAELIPGQIVNLEPALSLGARLGGHLVQGHVDTTGTLLSIGRQGAFASFRWSYPREFADLVVDKGSIAVDGVSLTIVEPDDTSFGVAVVPETMERTNLGRSTVGDRVNLEFDIMAKHARHLFLRYVENRP